MEIMKFIRMHGRVNAEMLIDHFGKERFEEISDELERLIEEQVVSKHFTSFGEAWYRYPFYTKKEEKEEEKNDDVYVEIEADPGVTLKELRGRVSLSNVALNKELERLIKAKDVKKKQDGNKVRFFPCRVDPDAEWVVQLKGVFKRDTRDVQENRVINKKLGVEFMWRGHHLWTVGEVPNLDEEALINDVCKTLSMGGWHRPSELAKRFGKEEVIEAITHLTELGMLEHDQDDNTYRFAPKFQTASEYLQSKEGE